MPNLTVAKVKAINASGRYPDGLNGLYLSVSKNSTKSWIQRVTLNGARTEKGLGSCSKVSLTNARKLAAQNRATISKGGNPWTGAKRFKMAELGVEVVKKVPTFREAAHIVHNDKIASGRWRNGKHTISWIQTLERHVFPALGDMPIDEITKADVLGVLRAIWFEIPENARRIRGRMRKVFSWAMPYDYITVNPAGEVIDGALVTMPKVQEHLKALPYQDVPAAIEKIRDSESWRATKLAFIFMVFTAARPGEARGARWDEIQDDVWVVDGSRMKGGQQHRQPLSIQAMQVIREARDRLGGDDLVFPSPAGRMLSENALPLRAKKCQLGSTAHGFRSSFRTWAAECSGATPDVIELSLAHAIGTRVQQAYFRTDLLDLRRPLLQSWADYLDPLPF